MTQTSDFHAATGLRSGSFGIATLAEGEREFPALVLPDGAVLDLAAEVADTHALFADWPRWFDRLVDLAAQPHRAVASFAELRRLPPLAHPNLLMAGANYKTHVAQMLTKNRFNQHNRLPGESDEAFYQRNYEMMERRAREGTPFFWTGLHSSMAGADDDIVLPVLGEQPDWELELGVVIGRHARFASVEEAAGLIAGYTIVNDLGTVDIFRRTDIPWGYDWVGKHQPTFKPIGPFIVPAAFVDPAQEMRIELRLNGEVMQDWPTNDMVFNPPQLLAYASERVRLMPGDILSTGSPPGNGMHHGRFMQDGDLVESSITGLGRQTNRCRAESRPARGLAFGHWHNPTP
jgi:2-keto-4-pentenoate hydratase/2-oxohepta-3-ene-1,7-dioic acid hydratase in catechol pathway